jgi:hypothetical protein
MKKLLYTFIFSFLVLMGSDLMAQSQTNLDKGLRFIEQNAENWGLQESDYLNSMVSDMYTDKKTGITYIYFIQAHNGIPIHNAITPLTVDSKGQISMVRHGYIQNAKELISATKPSLSPTAAIKSATAHLGIVASEMPAVLRSNTEKHTYEFGKANFAANDITVKLVYVKDEGQLKLAWSLAIDELEDEDYYNTFVDAISGEVISKYNFTVKCTFHKGKFAKHVGCSQDHTTKKSISTLAEANSASSAISVVGGTYNVFALPIESPIYGERTLEVNPFFTDSSPFGWHDVDGEDGAEFTITRGNNVHAYLDKQNTGFSSGDEPNGGDDLIFDLSYDAGNEASDNEQGATVNLFYTVNMFHDITKRLGFDEPAGNFQSNNYGNGGIGNDYVLAQASDGINLATPTLDNANFATPADGNNGQMQMYLWTNPSGVLSIDEPEVLAGFLSDVGDAQGTMGFGGPVPNEQGNPIVGKIVLARQDAPGEPTTVCGPIKNADEVAGNIAMIDRGLCDFSLKAWHAQEAGAISVIICNVVGGGGTDGLSSFGMAGGDNAELVTIVPLSLGKTDCDRIRASILSDIDVTVTIQNRGPVGPEFLDGSVDNGIVIHEYAHGLSTRLLGGPGSSGCLSSQEQPGEGISDFFTLALTAEEGDSGTDLRGIGNYADGQSTTGTGIRSFPYSTDIVANPLVYDNIKTRSPDATGSPHALGEVWTAALWEVYWAFVEEYGLDTKWEDENSGNYKAVRLVIDGMKRSPCNPSLIDLRNGILKADSVLYDAENSKLLWVAFAKRGYGYLADDGGTSDDVSDGTQSFEPFPLVIQELKINATSIDKVIPGDEILVELNAVNHIPETQTGVTITVTIPDGLTYIEGSASMPASFENGTLSISIGEMEYQEELTITYRAITSGSVKTQTIFYDNVDDADFGLYDFGTTEGTNFWFQSNDVFQSGFTSWWASQANVDEETDYWMNIPALDVVGERPALKFANRFDTEFGADAGFLQVSRDGGILYEDVKDKFIRNGYNSDIQYGTFAIPLLKAFSGTTNEEWIDSYLDLSDYKGEQIHVRFRFGTDDNTGVDATFPGWFVDDLEMVDLKTYESVACITSENSTEEQCTDIVEIFIESDKTINTSVSELDGFNISIAPNPASEYVSVGVSANENTPIQLMLTSIDGTVVRTTNMMATANPSVRTFNTSDLVKGMYLIQIKSEKGLTTKKIVVQ